MRAAVSTRYGSPDVVSVQEVADPVPGPGEILVRVDVSTVNRTDCAYRRASPFFVRSFTGLLRPRRNVLGTEFAGEVVGAGAGAHRFAVGERVFGYVEGRFGAHAELLVLAEDAMVATVPDGIDQREASAATEGCHYALSAIRRVGVRAGDRVLVNGGTGAIGSAAVQLLADLGARVTAVCPGEHADLVRGLGAEAVVDLDTEDFTATTLRYDVVIDAVGKSTFGRCRRVLTPDGVYVSSELGPYAQNVALALLGPLRRGRQRVVFPVPEEGQAMVEDIRDRLAAGTFRPVIDRTYPLADIVAAYRYVESGRKIGNVLLSVRPEPDA